MSRGHVELDLNSQDSLMGFAILAGTQGVDIEATHVGKDNWQIVIQSQFFLVPPYENHSIPTRLNLEEFIPN